uniref:RNase H type-1 domain-containing protein n=1 Tax=Fagus sylvatica TaxID=28930 RepID=A0A2N9GLN6_FAGSY
MEKLGFALLIVSRKLRPYFEAHSIIVMTDYPIRKAMNKPDAAGRLVQWSIEMSEFDIDYRPCTAIKAQALADFIAEFTHPLKEDEELEEGEAWTVNIDGSATKEMSGAGVILVSPEKDKFEYALQLRFRATNNEAEYEALLAGLKLSKSMGIKVLTVKSDSQLIVGEDNVAVDRLARLASSGIEIDGFIEIQGRPSTEEEIVNSITVNTTWMSPITRYLREGTLPVDRAEAHKLRIRASHFRSQEQATYWPSLLHDATQYVKTCDKCQRFANVPRVPPEEITPITSPWPFAQWGLDIMGPFPNPWQQFQKRMSRVSSGRPSSCRFGIPHPQANGQVEVTNRTLLKQIKTRLEGAKNMWVEELPKTTFHKEEENEGQLRLNLDLLDETREKAAQRIALYQGKMARYYNTKVKLRRFEIGDWVLRKVTQATKDPSQGKLGPNWEGPYKIIQYYRRGTYHLEDRHGKKLPHPWNAEHLKKYYP